MTTIVIVVIFAAAAVIVVVIVIVIIGTVRWWDVSCMKVGGVKVQPVMGWQNGPGVCADSGSMAWLFGQHC